MRLLHVVPSYIPAWRYGGPTYSVHALCKGLAARGHDVHVATTNVDGDQDSDVPLGHAVNLDGVAVHYFPSRFLRRLYYSRPMNEYFSTSFDGWDLIHTHSVFLWPPTAAARLARRRGKPYVVSPRGMLVNDLIARKSSLLKRAWIHLFEKANVAGAAAVHVTSQLEGEELLATGLRPRRLFEVPNGFDLPATLASDEAIKEFPIPKTYALFLGRISWKKGLDRLIPALAGVENLALVIAGNDDENYWPTLASLAKELSVDNRIHYVGFVEGKRKEALISNALFLALPSYSENFGNVVLEAMAVGVPVVVTPEVGLSRAVRTSGSGIVAEGNVSTLSAAMSSLLMNSSQRHEMGQRGRVAARAYSWDSVAAGMEEQYRMLLDRAAR